MKIQKSGRESRLISVYALYEIEAEEDEIYRKQLFGFRFFGGSFMTFKV